MNKDDVNVEEIDSIAGIVKCGNEYLVFYHKKLNMWTIPIGKVELGEPVKTALHREMREEVGITVLCSELLSNEVKYHYDNTLKVDLHLYMIHGYAGDVRNMEPHKHSDLKFITMKEIMLLNNKSDALKMLIRSEVGCEEK